VRALHLLCLMRRCLCNASGCLTRRVVLLDAVVGDTVVLFSVRDFLANKAHCGDVLGVVGRQFRARRAALGGFLRPSFT
jgi:hypothetical protein